MKLLTDILTGKFQFKPIHLLAVAGALIMGLGALVSMAGVEREMMRIQVKYIIVALGMALIVISWEPWRNRSQNTSDTQSPPSTEDRPETSPPA